MIDDAEKFPEFCTQQQQLRKIDIFILGFVHYSVNHDEVVDKSVMKTEASSWMLRIQSWYALRDSV